MVIDVRFDQWNKMSARSIDKAKSEQTPMAENGICMDQVIKCKVVR